MKASSPSNYDEPSPERAEDRESIDHWLRTAEPGFDRDGTPQWDGTRLDLDDVLSWLWVADQTRAA